MLCCFVELVLLKDWIMLTLEHWADFCNVKSEGLYVSPERIWYFVVRYFLIGDVSKHFLLNTSGVVKF